MNTCKTCKYRQPVGDRPSYSVKLPYICTNKKIAESDEQSLEDSQDMLIYSYDEGGCFHVGDDFGCVHHGT